MSDWKSGNAAPPRPVRREGAPPAPTRKTTPAGEAAAPAQEKTPVAAQPVVQEIPVVVPVTPPQTPVVSPQKTAPAVSEPAVAAKQGPVETKRSSIFAAPGSSPVVPVVPRSTTGSGTHPAVNQPLIVSALETATPVQEPPKVVPVAAPKVPVIPVQAAPVQTAPVMPERRITDSGPKFRNIRNQKMALSLPVVITHPSGKEDTRTVFVLSRGAVVFLSAPVQTGLQVNLKNPNNGKSSDCRVVSIERGPDGVNQVELEFMQPMPGFWPVHFPPEDWNPDDRKRPLPTAQPAKTAAAVPVTPTPAVEMKPAVTQPAAQPPVKDTRTAISATPAIKTPAQPVKVTPVTSRPAPVIAPLPVAEPVQPTSSLLASASSTTIERVERERSASGSGHHEARTSVSPHITVPTFAHGHSSRKPTGMILGILGVAVVAVALVGGWFYFKGGIGVSAGSKQPTSSAPTTSAPTNSNLVSPGANTGAATNPVAATGNNATTSPETNNANAASNNNRPETSPRENNSTRSARNNNPDRNNNTDRTVQQQPATQQQTPAELLTNNSHSALSTKTSDNTPIAPQPVLIAGNSSAPNINIPPVETRVTNAAKTPGISKGAMLTHQVKPIYPPAAMAARVAGPVTLQVQIDANGNVTSVRGVKGNPMLLAAATAAVKQWKYSPAIKDDKPVASTVEVPMNFTLPR